MGKPVVELAGQTFGKLTVLERAGSKHGHMIWLCQCECGNQAKVYRGELVKGKTKSCGCAQGKKPQSEYGKRHGTKLYDAWCNMKARCHNPKSKQYGDYGGRGIEVCERWRGDFLAFAADMGEPTDDALTIERIDNDRGYSPDNCTWASRSEQRVNQRRMKLTANDVLAIRLSSLSPTKLAEVYGVARLTIYRVRRRVNWKHLL